MFKCITHAYDQNQKITLRKTEEDKVVLDLAILPQKYVKIVAQ